MVAGNGMLYYTIMEAAVQRLFLQIMTERAKPI